MIGILLKGCRALPRYLGNGIELEWKKALRRTLETGINAANKKAEISVLGICWHHSRRDEKIIAARVKEWIGPNSL